MCRSAGRMNGRRLVSLSGQQQGRCPQVGQRRRAEPPPREVDVTEVVEAMTGCEAVAYRAGSSDGHVEAGHRLVRALQFPENAGDNAEAPAF